jgi:hypothetical protein
MALHWNKLVILDLIKICIHAFKEIFSRVAQGASGL